jgi:hypothetical protein
LPLGKPRSLKVVLQLKTHIAHKDFSRGAQSDTLNGSVTSNTSPERPRIKPREKAGQTEELLFQRWKLTNGLHAPYNDPSPKNTTKPFHKRHRGKGRVRARMID